MSATAVPRPKGVPQPKSVAPAKTVLETVLEWSGDRAGWQRDALRRIVQKGRLDDNDIAELVGLCKEVRAATSGTSAKLQPLKKSHLPANPGAADSVSLAAIKDVTAVNNLAPSQTLSFEPAGITVVYGDNGAGKSGYARILKRACRARHSGEILSNIYAQPTAEPPSATIVFNVGGVEQPPESWKDAGHPHSVLSAVSVFDRECAAIHIDGKNEVAFRPFGLDVPDELANTCQRVKEALTDEQKALEKTVNPIFLNPTWKQHTAAGKALGSLKHDADAKIIAVLATLSDNEASRLASLKEDRSKDPGKAAAEQKLKADNIKGLIEALATLEALTNDAALSGIFALHRDAVTNRGAAVVAAQKAFSGDALPGVGGDVWRVLWESARRYSAQVAYPGEDYPPTKQDALCVLCQQPLSVEALARMARFEEFIRQDTERQAQAAENTATAAFSKLAAHRIDMRATKSSRQEVGLSDPAVAGEALRFMASVRLRRYALKKAVKDGAQKLDLRSFSADPKPALRDLEKKTRAYAQELQNSAKADERQKLEAEFAELSDRALLSDLMPIVRGEVDRLKKIHFLSQCVADTTTNAITKIGNDIADTVITPQLRDRFQQEIIKLAADKVRVEIVRSGGKYGSPQYQIRFFAAPNAKVASILSEGEQTCVALAAFLTELATASHRSALVFDDPVSSLDHRWRRQVAYRLVEEAAVRQVIVFTHDLVFVNDLHDRAIEHKRPIRLATVSRGQPGAGLVSVGLPWAGTSVEDRIDKLEKDARAAKKLYDGQQEDEYRRAAAEVYANLRASWERGLEDVALARVVLRHRDYIDTKNLIRVSVLTDADCDAFRAAFNKCSDIVNAHDPSSGRNAEAPPPDELLRDIKALKDWVSSLRDRQKKLK
jgi:energy-coupling factor transporter ATP-binding protein EcfA2